MALNATITPFPADFEVWEVHLSDGMDRPFDLLVRGSSTAPGVDLRSMLGHRITLSLPDETMLSSVNGIVTRAARRTPEPNGVTVYEIHVAPAEWTLTKRRNSRIFQNQTVLQIVATILGEHALATSMAVFSRELPVREYCVQYDETDSELVHRLLAEEGMASYFDQSAGGRWSLVDDTTLHKPSRDPEALVHANPANLKPAALAVLRWRFENSVEPIGVTRRDFDFERPQLTLEHTALMPPADASAAETGLEEYTYEPGRLLAAADGDEAMRDVEALRGAATVVHLETNFAACAGTPLHIEGDDLSGDFLVTGCDVHFESHAGGERRAITLTAIPLATRHRPAHRKRPLIFGTQSARVVGDTPEGTVDVDGYGRVKIEMRWDRRNLWASGGRGRGNPTRRVRVAQAWAGPGYGLVTLPRVGDEVLVAYSDGNPDEPVVIGRVHNAVSTTPLDLPETDKTKAIWKSQSFGPNGPEEGYNAIVMDDAAGAEVLGIKAQRDYLGIVGRNATTTIVADESTTIGGDRTLVIGGSQNITIGGRRGGGGGGGGGGGASATDVTGNQMVKVTGMYALAAKGIELSSSDTLTLRSKANMRLECEADRTDNSVNHLLSADNTATILAATVTISGKEIRLVSEGGASTIVITDGGITITSSGPVEVNGNPIYLNC